MSSDESKISVDEKREEDVNEKLKKAVSPALQSSQKAKHEKYETEEKVVYNIVDVINSHPETMNPDGTLNKEVILRLVFDPGNPKSPISRSEKREENSIEVRKSGGVSYYVLGSESKSMNATIPDKTSVHNDYKIPTESEKVAEDFIDQLNDQIISNKEISDTFVTDFVERRKPPGYSSPTNNPFGKDSSGGESTGTSSTISTYGDTPALSKYEETLFKTASEANDTVDKLKELYSEIYDNRGISSAEERAQPGWEPSYLDKQFDLRIMDIEEQSKSRNRALILTMAGIDLRGEMEEARKLISFKTKELRDIGHDPDGFRRTQYQKQSQFLLQSFGLLMQIAPNAFSSKYALNHNAWALSNGIDPRSLANLGAQYSGIGAASLPERTDEGGGE